jgi:hypothetical protein
MPSRIFERSSFERGCSALDWAVKTFGPEAGDPVERASRFVEEAIELAHAAGVSRERLGRTVERIYRASMRRPLLEIGQAQLTLDAYAATGGQSAAALAESEFERVQRLDPAVLLASYERKKANGEAGPQPGAPRETLGGLAWSGAEAAPRASQARRGAFDPSRPFTLRNGRRAYVARDEAGYDVVAFPFGKNDQFRAHLDGKAVGAITPTFDLVNTGEIKPVSAPTEGVQGPVFDANRPFRTKDGDQAYVRPCVLPADHGERPKMFMVQKDATRYLVDLDGQVIGMGLGHGLSLVNYDMPGWSDAGDRQQPIDQDRGSEAASPLLPTSSPQHTLWANIRRAGQRTTLAADGAATEWRDHFKADLYATYEEASSADHLHPGLIARLRLSFADGDGLLADLQRAGDAVSHAPPPANDDKLRAIIGDFLWRLAQMPREHVVWAVDRGSLLAVRDVVEAAGYAQVAPGGPDVPAPVLKVGA